jgi:hypothetical protein
MSLGPLAFHWLTPAIHEVVRWRLTDLARWVCAVGLGEIWHLASLSEAAMSR